MFHFAHFAHFETGYFPEYPPNISHDFLFIFLLFPISVFPLFQAFSISLFSRTLSPVPSRLVTVQTSLSNSLHKRPFSLIQISFYFEIFLKLKSIFFLFLSARDLTLFFKCQSQTVLLSNPITCETLTMNSLSLSPSFERISLIRLIRNPIAINWNRPARSQLNRNLSNPFRRASNQFLVHSNGNCALMFDGHCEHNQIQFESLDEPLLTSLF